ncbi:DUF975 family protein [Aerococcus suis]|uniref:Uncharacterized membrane protein n=1 Tax=Aerococcus suis TaxID=371602 RepID=A0A1W1Y411_9LACT|nr:DUF975 family protein [Aerococcus suis]SMC30889.1 Uncharacterized membrane protein [Aerococcus suis]
MSERQHKKIAKQFMRRNWPWYVVLTIVFTMAISIASLSPVLTFPLGIILAIVSALLVTGLQTAYKRLLMVIKNGLNPELSRDFVAPLLNYSLSYTITLWLKYLYLTFWTCLLIIPGIYKWLSYALVEYIIIDFPQIRYNEAITASRQLMRGHKWQLIGLYCRFILWDIIIMLTFGLAYFYVKPYFTLAMIDFYEMCLEENGYPQMSSFDEHRWETEKHSNMTFSSDDGANDHPSSTEGANRSSAEDITYEWDDF